MVRLPMFAFLPSSSSFGFDDPGCPQLPGDVPFSQPFNGPGKAQVQKKH